MIPDKKEAHRILREAEQKHPGSWICHSKVVAECACKIAENCKELNSEKAYVLGLLHDIGRSNKENVQLKHIVNGYRHMKQLGYDEVSRICLSHSFPLKDIRQYPGASDVPQEDRNEMLQILERMEYDDYDRLIQLCDSISMPEGVVLLETRIADIKKRYGKYLESKKESLYKLKQYFEDIMGLDLYDVLRINL